jgi:hypothetical protein
MKIWSRRKFIEAGVLGSIAMGGTAAAGISSVPNKKTEQNHAAAVPESNKRNLLTAVMDEIIPAADGMPAASEVGGLNYIEKLVVRDAKNGDEIRKSLNAIEIISQKRFQVDFVSLTSEKRKAVLTALETQDAANFAGLRDAVYEAYYEQPQVWKLIDYTCYETNGGGPAMEPFHEEILSEVRKKPKGYREA